MHFRRDYRAFDYVLALLVIALCVFGIIMIGSVAKTDVGATQKVMETARRVYRSQYMWVTTGIIIMLVAAFVDYELLGRFYIVIYAVNLSLLLLVLFFGRNSEDPARWLMLSDFGIPKSWIDFGIQPSEFTKIFMIIYLAKFIDKNKERINNILTLLLTIAFSVVPIALIAVQPSLSASLVPVIIMLTMLYTAKISYKYIIIAVALLVPLLVFLYYDLHSDNPLIISKLPEYQVNRIMGMLYPEENPETQYQVQQSILAINSGQLLGRGLYKNVIFVPYSYNDFVFSIIGAELGFVGGIAVIGVMFVIIVKCLYIAYKSEIFFGKLIAAGVAAMFTFQTFVNVSVNVGLLPTTGISFPFMSSGGSSMWINMGCVGLVISVGMTKSKMMFEK